MRKPFLPAWYLQRGTMKHAGESKLDEASSSCERWSIWFGGLVVVAVIAELVIDWFAPPYSVFLTESAVTRAAIAIGIVGEVAFGMWDSKIQTELRRRSNDKLGIAEKAAAEANERALAAQMEAERVRSLASGRRLTVEQLGSIAEAIGERRLSALIVYPNGDIEAYLYALDISGALAAAGCSTDIEGGVFTSPTFGIHLLPRPGDSGAANDLEAALKAGGIDVFRHDGPRPEAAPKLQLTVGSRPPPSPPYQTIGHTIITRGNA